MTQAILKAPFPSVGGKARVARLTWQRLGNVDSYIEPFCRSAAVMLQRPAHWPPTIETINDYDCLVANFWRATKYAGEKVAEYADNPVNEADLHARHRFLMLGPDAEDFRQRMRTEPDYFDARIAGWWCWGSCCWIGPGWCSERDMRTSGDMSQAITHIGDGGRGANASMRQYLPKLGQYSGKIVPECSSNPTRGLSISRPCLEGRGVNPVNGDLPQGRPSLNGTRGGAVSNCGVHNAPTDVDESLGVCEQRQAWLLRWFQRLRDRLRTVRVCCGDWQRVCDSHSTTTRLGLTGIFLDPPYRTELADGTSNRNADLYASDKDADVGQFVDRVIAYCLERGSNPQIRIAVCCYEGEGYEALAEKGWTVESWKANGGYSNTSGKANDNAGRERIWFSPHCRPPEQPLLFKDTEDSETRETSGEPAAQLALAA
jgi:DNA adenine methylase